MGRSNFLDLECSASIVAFFFHKGKSMGLSDSTVVSSLQCYHLCLKAHRGQQCLPHTQESKIFSVALRCSKYTSSGKWIWVHIIFWKRIVLLHREKYIVYLTQGNWAFCLCRGSHWVSGESEKDESLFLHLCSFLNYKSFNVPASCWDKSRPYSNSF